jgi:hypothetical protein
MALVAPAAGSVFGNSQHAWERAQGAAAGGAAVLATARVLVWNEGDKVTQKHVWNCLQTRGHGVAGWR